MSSQLSTTEGRWLSPDPYSGSVDLTNPQSLNRYAYVGSNSINTVDVMGLKASRFCDDMPGAGCMIHTGMDFGSTWNEFDLLQMTITPTALLLVPDPEFVVTGNSLLIPVYGNWDLFSYIGQVIWSPPNVLLAGNPWRFTPQDINAAAKAKQSQPPSRPNLPEEPTDNPPQLDPRAPDPNNPFFWIFSVWKVISSQYSEGMMGFAYIDVRKYSDPCAAYKFPDWCRSPIY